MSAGQALQLMGTASILILAGLLFDVARNVQRFTRFGREALVCIASYLLMVAVIRMLVLFGWLDQVEGRIVNGMLAIPFIVILGQIVWIRNHVNGREKSYEIPRTSR